MIGNKITIKKQIRNIISNFGIDVIRHRKSPYEYLLGQPRYELKKINLIGKTFNVADGHSFYYSHREIFIDEIYKFHAANSSPNILDCGSNYGTSILYFKQLYPDAKITGVEADPGIYDLLEHNISQHDYSDVKLLNMAVSTSSQPVKFFSEGADGGRLHKLDDPNHTYEINSITLDNLIEGQVDFLKMDIEGAESEVLLNSTKLSQVEQMFIEYHSFEDDTQSLGELLACLSKNDFKYYIHTQFCSKRPLTEKSTQLGMDMQLNIFAKRNLST